jgi:phosphatidylinositol phospholipase C delta
MCRKYIPSHLISLVDCWDGPQGEPLVFHGRTFTSKILLRDVLEAIRKYSFVVSEYPVVLSFEIHCSPEQQLVISSMLRHIFGDGLFLMPVEATGLPILSSLMGRTLVKAKIFEEDEDEDVRDEFSSPESLFAEAGISSPSPTGKNSDEGYFKRRKPSIVQDLLSLLTLKTRSFNGFDVSRDSFQFDQMSSIGERRSINLALKQRSEYVKHNSRLITRVYPASLRITSSNFDPVAHWKSGCQV